MSDVGAWGSCFSRGEGTGDVTFRLAAVKLLSRAVESRSSSFIAPGAMPTKSDELQRVLGFTASESGDWFLSRKSVG